MVFSQKLNNHRILKRLAKALISLRVHTKLLEISCTGSFIITLVKYGSVQPACLFAVKVKKKAKIRNQYNTIKYHT